VMRISPFADNLILISNRLVRNERQYTVKFYRLRFCKERKGVFTYGTILGMTPGMFGMRA
jgi:hypothetical protein